MSLKVAVRGFLRPRGFEFRRWDEDIALDTFLWHLFPRLGINTVLDVGARWGHFGKGLRDNGYQGHLVSLEPVSSNYEVLSEACAADPKWTAHRVAVGSADGEIEINVTQMTVYSSIRDMNAEAQEVLAGSDIVGRERVPIRRLDGLFEEITAHIPEPRIYLKIDTQGWDLEVLRGAAGCLGRVAALQTEVSLYPVYKGTPSFEESREAFGNAGFETAALFPVARLDGWRLAEMDSVMLRGDRPFG